MSSSAPAPPPPIADVFCRVIDNLGDVGVCWRLSQILAQAGWQVRLWVDDARALAFMAPAHVQAPESQAGVCVRDWTLASDAGLLSRLAAADLWVEAFGCELPTAFVAHAVRTRAHPPRWVNLEYLSAEDWVPRLHGLPSPVTTGPAQGWTKQFIYPGFEATTGGLLREPDLLSRQAGFEPLAWLAQMGVTARPQALRVSLFCYEPPALAAWLVHLSQQAHNPADLVELVRRESATCLQQSRYILPGSNLPHQIPQHHAFIASLLLGFGLGKPHRSGIHAPQHVAEFVPLQFTKIPRPLFVPAQVYSGEITLDRLIAEAHLKCDPRLISG